MKILELESELRENPYILNDIVVIHKEERKQVFTVMNFSWEGGDIRTNEYRPTKAVTSWREAVEEMKTYLPKKTFVKTVSDTLDYLDKRMISENLIQCADRIDQQIVTQLLKEDVGYYLVQIMD